ncbi:MAG TPA: hypothetical protein VGF59_09730 [Bryobacteraceae bacterium]
MSPCEQWRDRLLDCALGAPAEPDLSSHLASCPACAEALAVWRANAARLDAAVGEFAAANPAPGAAERALTRIGVPRPSLPYLRIAAGVAALVVPALLILWPAPRPSIPSATTQLSLWRSPTDSLLRSPADSLLREVPRLGVAAPVIHLNEKIHVP